MDRGAWRATDDGVAKELDMTERLSTHARGSAAYARSHELWGLGQGWPRPVPGFAGG